MPWQNLAAHASCPSKGDVHKKARNHAAVQHNIASMKRKCQAGVGATSKHCQTRGFQVKLGFVSLDKRQTLGRRLGRAAPAVQVLRLTCSYTGGRSRSTSPGSSKLHGSPSGTRGGSCKDDKGLLGFCFECTILYLRL